MAQAPITIAELKRLGLINIDKLHGCSRHRFVPAEVKVGAYYTCLNCGGQIGAVDLGFYIDGYKAAGGNVNDVFPGWTKTWPPAKDRT
jgi:hypothetical protein